MIRSFPQRFLARALLGRLKLLGQMLSDKRLQVLAGPKADPITSYAYWLISARSKPRPDVLTTAQWVRSQAAAIDSGSIPGDLGALPASLSADTK
jgi:hypothetical protein